MIFGQANKAYQEYYKQNMGMKNIIFHARKEDAFVNNTCGR